jgi:hypothetical protein
MAYLNITITQWLVYLSSRRSFFICTSAGGLREVLLFYEMKKTVLFLSILVSLFWLASRFINIYRFALVGAIFEILWLPMILMVFGLPLISFYYLLKDKFSVNSTYLYAILIMIFTFLIMLFFK